MLYGINKRRRELGLEPYAFSSVFDSLVKLIQIPVTKASFFRKNFSLSVSNMRVSMGLSVWRETSKKLTVCREKGKKLTVCRELFCTDNRVVCSFS